MNDPVLVGLAIVFAVIICIALYLLPTIIAFRRIHHYKWIICATNILLGLTIVGYFAALIWAIWPRQNALPSANINDPPLDPNQEGNAVNDPMGDSNNSSEPGTTRQQDTMTKSEVSGEQADMPNGNKYTFNLGSIEQDLIALAKLKETGLLSDVEFKKMKNQIIGLQ